MSDPGHLSNPGAAYPGMREKEWITAVLPRNDLGNVEEVKILHEEIADHICPVVLISGTSRIIRITGKIVDIVVPQEQCHLVRKTFL